MRQKKIIIKIHIILKESFTKIKSINYSSKGVSKDLSSCNVEILFSGRTLSCESEKFNVRLTLLLNESSVLGSKSYNYYTLGRKSFLNGTLASISRFSLR